MADHPHVRGENIHRQFIAHVIPGSSPRAWGKLSNKRRKERNRRIIPTCVGKTTLGFGTKGHYTDHPHVRGENAALTSLMLGGFGSSPRAWGKPPKCMFRKLVNRIIPTCVGKTRITPKNGSMQSDHPHVRGENDTVASHDHGNVGSSPRAWGKLG